MLFNIREIRTSLVEKFGEAAIHFQELSCNEGFIVNPTYQLCVFNYLLYEKNWRFDSLKDIALSFNPELNRCEYSLHYQLDSKLYHNRLKLLLPVNFSKGQVYSLSNRYKNAVKMEQELADIYKIQFVTKPTRLERLRKKIRNSIEPAMQNLPALKFF